MWGIGGCGVYELGGLDRAALRSGTPGQQAAWDHVWHWLSGHNQATAKNGSGNGTHVAQLIGGLRHAAAPDRLNAVYALGAAGVAAVSLLISALRDTAEPVEITDEPLLNHVACALSAIGAPAVPALIFVLNDDVA